ncbi:MAG: S-layer homology domain-containing protein [Firmicutes bacterium]|nr:S-layer homology domain-containing protein [Bacillota bacterium]
MFSHFFRKQIVALFLLLFLLWGFLFTFPAEGAVTINRVYVDDELIFDSDTGVKNDYLTVLKNSVFIKVYAPGAEKVRLGSVSVVGSAYEFEVPDYRLNPGNNGININATGQGGTAKFYFAINYCASPLSGASYRLDQLPSSGRIDAFNRALSLVCPRGTILLDGAGNPVTTTVTFTVYDTSGGPAGWTPAGLTFKISTAQAVYLSQHGQLILPYKTSISSTDVDLLSVWYSPDGNWQGGSTLNLGGLTDPRRRTVAVPFQFKGVNGYYAVFLCQQVIQERDLNLDPEESWAFPCVATLQAKGIVEPVTVGNTNETTWDNGFFGLISDRNNPSSAKKMTRLEFATMLVKGLGLPLAVVSDSVFDDVKNGFNPAACYASAYGGNENQYNRNSMYFYPDAVDYVETAAENGIIKGFPGSSGGVEFRPQETLTREQVAVILVRVANLKVSDDVGQARQALEKVFIDGGSISSWAAPSVLAAYNAKLVAGIPDGKTLKFDPKGEVTRAQAITLVYRLLKKLKKI